MIREYSNEKNSFWRWLKFLMVKIIDLERLFKQKWHHACIALNVSGSAIVMKHHVQICGPFYFNKLASNNNNLIREDSIYLIDQVGNYLDP